MSDTAEQKLIRARVRMLMRHPFFGQLALRLKLTNASDWCPTAATDGRHFYYNEEFIMQLDADEVVFLVGHEIGHCIYEHFLRVGDRDKRIWNMAGDYKINAMLVREKIGRLIDKVTPLYDRKYDTDEWYTENIYDELIASGAEAQDTLDVHLDMSGEGSNGPSVSISAEEVKKLQDELKEAMIQAAQSAGAGNVPAEIQRMINQLVEPKMNWRELLRATIESNVKNDFTFQRPNRKGWHTGAILPGMDRDQQINIAVGIDTSGSIDTEMLRDFVSEVAGIMEQFGDYQIRIWQFDTAVYGDDTFTHDDGRDIREYEIRGGGGTDFVVNWTHMEDNDIVPDQFIMFTDGMPWGSWGNEDYCDTTFLIHGKYGRTVEAPFGNTVHYDAA